MQICPRCDLGNPPNAVRCDCGFDFATRTVQESYLEKARAARSPEDAELKHLWFRAKLALGAEVVIQLILAKPTAAQPTYQIAELLGNATGSVALPFLVVALASIWPPNRTSRRMANILYGTSMVCITLVILAALTRPGPKM